MSGRCFRRANLAHTMLYLPQFPTLEGRAMTARPDPSVFDRERFGVGQPVPRTEDPVLVRGEGRYTDDLSAEGQVYLAMVRSPIAHGTIRSIDLDQARAMEGVLGAWTGADLKEAGYGRFVSKITFPNRDGSPYRQPVRYPLAIDRVRYVGDPVAFVVATSPALAKDAAEAVVVEIEQLPTVMEVAEAVKADAPLLYDNIPGNTTLDYYHGDAAATEAAFGQAAHVARLSLVDFADHHQSDGAARLPCILRCGARALDATCADAGRVWLPRPARRRHPRRSSRECNGSNGPCRRFVWHARSGLS